MEVPLWLVAWTIYSAGFGAAAVHVSNDGDGFLESLMWGALWPLVVAAATIDGAFRLVRGLARLAQGPSPNHETKP